MKKLKFLNISLRSKMVITLSLVVATVSCILLYFTSKMIIEDKRAYLYDTAYQSLDSGFSALEQFFQAKRNYVNIFLAATARLEDIDKKRFESDRDLYEVSYIAYLEDKKTPEGIYTIYKNKSYLDNYKRKEKFLDVPESFFVEQGKAAVSDTIVEKIYSRKGKAPRLMLFVYVEKSNRVIVFDFLLDNIYNSNFSKQSFEVGLFNANGEYLFHNRPYETSPEHTKFFKTFIEMVSQKDEQKNNGGVSERKIAGRDYILGHKQLSRFPDHFLFYSIKTSEAFEVTSVLIINTIVYTLSLLALFNLISILIARSITNPLNKLTEVIKNISSGKYEERVATQSTTELQLVADAFNEMVDKIQDYQGKLIDYNKTLEQKVEERTESLKKANNFIKTMVDSLDQGLLVFDKDGVCLDLHTKACVKLIGSNPTGKPLNKLIKAQDSELLKDWIANLFEEMIPFESLVELGQKSIPCNEHYTSPQFKHVTLEFQPMRNEEGAVQNVVMIASDKTREFKAYKEVEAQQNYVKLVTKVLKDKNSFVRFASMFEQAMTDEKEKIKSDKFSNKDDFMRLLHSMKGSAGFYSLQEVVQYVHEFETDIGEDNLSDEQIIERIDGSVQKLIESTQKLKDIIGDTSKSVIEVEESKLRRFWNDLYQRNADAAQFFAGRFLQKEAESYVHQYKELVLDLSLKLGKKIKPLNIENGNLLLDMNYFQEFFDSCIHLFRNAVDHAIENPDVRASNGKVEDGTINVSFNVIKGDKLSLLEFTVRDDGGGIDAQRVRNKMRDLNYPEQVLNKPDNQIIYHIFDPYFSTAENISDLSGRGVGLFDIKKNIEKLNGTIELETRVGKGTVFSFLIPLPEKII